MCELELDVFGSTPAQVTLPSYSPHVATPLWALLSPHRYARLTPHPQKGVQCKAKAFYRSDFTPQKPETNTTGRNQSENFIQLVGLHRVYRLVSETGLRISELALLI